MRWLIGVGVALVAVIAPVRAEDLQSMVAVLRSELEHMQRVVAQHTQEITELKQALNNRRLSENE